MHGSYTPFYMRLDAKHVCPRLRGASGDVRRCRGEQHDRKRTVEFETMLDLRDVSGSAARSRLLLGAFDDAHLVTRSSCRSVCSCSGTRGTRRPRAVGMLRGAHPSFSGENGASDRHGNFFAVSGIAVSQRDKRWTGPTDRRATRRCSFVYVVKWGGAAL